MFFRIHTYVFLRPKYALIFIDLKRGVKSLPNREKTQSMLINTFSPIMGMLPVIYPGNTAFLKNVYLYRFKKKMNG